MVTWYEYWGPYWREYLGPVRWLPHAAIQRLAVPLGRRAIADSRLAADRVPTRPGHPGPGAAGRSRAASSGYSCSAPGPPRGPDALEAPEPPVYVR